VAAELTELRLPRFKSVRDAVIPIRPLTLIVGRNGSGKSNVLDGLAVLAALASGTDLRDALDGGRDGPVVRGGSEGCSPLGSKSFTIGCTAHQDSQEIYLDVEIQTSPSLQIISERLWTVRKSGVRKGEALDYLRSEPPQPYSGDIVARWDNGKRGTNPGVTFRASQLLTSQIGVRVPATTQAGRRVHEAAAIVLGAISGIFILDPVPHQMREYVPEKDSRLRRNADNLSATLARLLRSKSLASTPLAVPARLMSDGTLRFLAIAAAMLDVPEANESQQEDDGGRVLVVEELENGLHPSQAALLLSRLKGSAQEREVRTVATTHSPAILDALTGQDHESVVVSSRDKDGWSRITRLVDFPDYFEVVGRTSLGASATMDRLRPGKVNEDAVQQTLTSIFGN
jgi:energy-coupling factor transporter ATP-binding protein EcfA2